jgi:hypothetical protein
LEELTSTYQYPSAFVNQQQPEGVAVFNRASQETQQAAQHLILFIQKRLRATSTC